MALKDRALRMGMQWLDEAMRDPSKADRVMGLMAAWQKGWERLKVAQEEALHAVGLPSQADVSALGRRLSGVRKRVKVALGRVQRLPGPSA